MLLKAAVLAAVLGRASAQPSATIASQTFFVPMPEDRVMGDTFKQISVTTLSGSTDTVISVAISADGTKVFWDHWEDGFEPDATNPVNKTTEIWGDGNPANGCPPSCTASGCVPTKSCTAAQDVLKAGQVFVVENDVEFPRNKALIKYDGGDRVQASAPITIVRAAYPVQSDVSSMLAGAVEVIDTSKYGTRFVTPGGTDSGVALSAFEYATVYITASQDGTLVTCPNATTVTLNMGQTALITAVTQNKVITASKPAVAYFITGDKASNYQLRWYSLLDSSMWSNAYLGSVGDTNALVKYYVFSETSQTVSYSYLSATGVKTDATLVVSAGGNKQTVAIPDGSGIYLSAPNKFLALSIHDTNQGQIYDWGYPVMPLTWLAPNALVGLGWGCTDNACGMYGTNGPAPRSWVFVTPMEDGYINVDYNNDGIVDKQVAVKALSATAIQIDKVTKTVMANSFTTTNYAYGNNDMSGAFIFGTKTSSTTSTAILIAVAWGQWGKFSGSGDNKALDMGTVVLPLPSVRVAKTVSLHDDNDMNSAVSAGDVLEYTIQVLNSGVADIAAGDLTVKDPVLPSGVTYVPGTFTYTDSVQGVIAATDDTTGTPFPLDGTGMVSKAVLAKRGGFQLLKFQVTVNEGTPGNTVLTNSGTLSQKGVTPDLTFSVDTTTVAKMSWGPPLIIPPASGGSCLQDSWKAYGKTGALSCTAKEVYLDEVTSTSPKQCQVGKTIKLNLTALVHFNGAAKFDPGWYIAKDGGDALTGQCAVGFLDQKYADAAKITATKDLNLLTGTVEWNKDVNTAAGNDECGDVTALDTAGGVMKYNILLDSEIKCKDDNKDGKLDFSICFSWKGSSADSKCSVLTRLANGQVPELYPGTSSSCFCAKYDIPNVVPLDPGTKVYPC